MATFIDRAVLHITGGDGGNGCASIKREKFKPLAGPDGANGGDGGNVILEVSRNVTTLMDFHHLPHRRAESGGFVKVRGSLRRVAVRAASETQPSRVRSARRLVSLS